MTGQLPRPNEIWVYDFAVTAAEVPPGSAFAGQASDASQTPEELATGQQSGTEIASRLVQQIQSMGMPAARAGAGTMPQINDIVIRAISFRFTRAVPSSASPSASAPGHPI